MDHIQYLRRKMQRATGRIETAGVEKGLKVFLIKKKRLTMANGIKNQQRQHERVFLERAEKQGGIIRVHQSHGRTTAELLQGPHSRNLPEKYRNLFFQANGADVVEITSEIVYRKTQDICRFYVGVPAREIIYKRI